MPTVLRFRYLDMKVLCDIAEPVGVVGGWVAAKYYDDNPSWLFAAGAIYVIARLLRIYYEKQLYPKPEKGVIDRILWDLYTELFDEKPGHRITLFRPHPKKPDRIVATNRWAYGSGGKCQSKAWFNKGSGLAGLAWDKPGQPVFQDTLPTAQTRQEYIKNYSPFAIITKKQVRSLSNHALCRVRRIYCLGFVDRNKNFAGVISIDSEDPSPFSKDFSQEEVVKACRTLTKFFPSVS